MAISFSGLASGLDSATIVSALVKAESVPLTRVQSESSAVRSASSSLSSFMSKVTALRDAAKALSTNNGYTAFSATSSDAGVTASVTGAASAGSFSIKVESLATEQRTRSDLQDSSTDPLSMVGTIDLTVGGGSTVSVNVTSGDSLTDIAANISSSGARVSASVIYDGSKYQLLVRGLDTGDANSITFAENGLSLGLTKPANTYQSAANSHVTIDNVDVSRATNVVAGAIPGVTLNLKSKMSATGTLGVASDSGALSTKIKALVSAYNDVVNTGHSLAGYGKSTASNKQLAGDSAVRSVLDRIASIATGPVANTTGLYRSLGAAGLTTSRDGLLQLDQTKLDAALAADPDGVKRLFVEDASSGSTGAMTSLMSAIDSMTVGTSATLVARISAFDARATRLDKQADSLQTRLDAYQDMLNKQFTALEMQMSAINLQSAALSGVYSAIGSSSSSSSSSSKG